MTWLFVAGGLAVVLGALPIVRRRSAADTIPNRIIELSRISNAIVVVLTQQAILFGHELRTMPSARAGDDWSNGYIHGFARYILEQPAKFDQTEIAAAIANIFEQLFGRSEGKRINALRDIEGQREQSARSGFLSGENDARRFLQSGGNAGTNGWLQHVKSDLFSVCKPDAFT
jgi:hypothetical protein